MANYKLYGGIGLIIVAIIIIALGMYYIESSGNIGGALSGIGIFICGVGAFFVWWSLNNSKTPSDDDFVIVSRSPPEA